MESECLGGNPEAAYLWGGPAVRPVGWCALLPWGYRCNFCRKNKV